MYQESSLTLFFEMCEIFLLIEFEIKLQLLNVVKTMFTELF